VDGSRSACTDPEIIVSKVKVMRVSNTLPTHTWIELFRFTSYSDYQQQQYQLLTWC